MKKPVIEIKNLTKRFKDKLILDNINLKIYPGEIFGLLGSNGAGKTVLIQTLLGLIKPEAGKIKILGCELNGNLSEIYSKINFASAYSHLQDQITIKENLLTYSGLYGIKNSSQKISQLVKFFGLDKYSIQNTKVMHLSSGENARLLLCKSLINDPQILFLDEPTASLDPKIRKSVIDSLLKIHKRKLFTIFYASHNLGEVENFCTHIGFLKKGKLMSFKNKSAKDFIKFY